MKRWALCGTLPICCNWLEKKCEKKHNGLLRSARTLAHYSVDFHLAKLSSLQSTKPVISAWTSKHQCDFLKPDFQRILTGQELPAKLCCSVCVGDQCFQSWDTCKLADELFDASELLHFIAKILLCLNWYRKFGSLSKILQQVDVTFWTKTKAILCACQLFQK